MLILFFLRYFISIKVRLELASGENGEDGNEFQFHKGTIRTLDSRIKLQDSMSFQFHKGTIRTEVWPTNPT